MASPREIWQRYLRRLKRERQERRRQKTAADPTSEPTLAEPSVGDVPGSAERLPNPPPLKVFNRRILIESSSSGSGSPCAASSHSSRSHLLPGPTPEEQSAARDGLAAESGEIKVRPKTPSLIVRAVAAGRRRSKRSATKSSDTCATGFADANLRDANVTTLTHNVLRRRQPTSSFSVGTTLLGGSEYEEDPEACYMCGQKLGMPRCFDDKIDQKAFLPCGHAMGTACLYRWLVKKKKAVKRCPKCRVTLRHSCEHISWPTPAPPQTPFTDNSTPALPFDYEFCKTPRGATGLEELKAEVGKLREMETKWRDRRRDASALGLAITIEYQEFVVDHLEKKLDEKRKAWCEAKWVEYGFGKPRGFLERSLSKFPPLMNLRDRGSQKSSESDSW